MHAVAGEWRTFRGPGDGAIADSFVTFAVHSPVIGLLLRDGSGQVWLGWTDSAAAHFDVSWQNLGGSFTRGPFVQTVGSEAVVLAASADDSLSFAALGEPYEAGAAPTWASLGLDSSHDPVTASWGPGRIDVFGLGDDRTIRQTWLLRHADGWAAKGQWIPVAEEVAEMPTAVSWGPDRLDLFGRSADGSVLHKWWDDAADRLDIFTVENTSKTTHKYWHPGTGWLPASPTQWEDIGGPLTAPPVVVTWGSYQLDLFGQSSEGHLRHFWWGPENGWEPSDGWEDMRGVLASAPIAFAWGPDRLGVFAVSVENTLIYKYRDPGIFWRPSLTRWHESRFPGVSGPAVRSLRADITRSGLAVISVVEDSLDRAHVGIFRP
jgi:hypothetical protein